MAAPDSTGFVAPENQQPVGPWPDDILGRNYDMSGGSFGPFPHLPPAAPSTQQFWNQTLLQTRMSPGTGVRVPEYPALIPPTVAQEPKGPPIQGLQRGSWGLGSNGKENRLKHRLSAAARSSRCKHRTSLARSLTYFPSSSWLSVRDGRTGLRASWPPSGLE